jgi:hypothetical protein
MIVATGSPEGAELVAGMVEHVNGKNAEGELVGGQGGQRLIVSTRSPATKTYGRGAEAAAVVHQQPPTLAVPGAGRPSTGEPGSGDMDGGAVGNATRARWR